MGHKNNNDWKGRQTYKFPCLTSEHWEFYYDENHQKSSFAIVTGILIKPCVKYYFLNRNIVWN